MYENERIIDWPNDGWFLCGFLFELPSWGVENRLDKVAALFGINWMKLKQFKKELKNDIKIVWKSKN